jgi:ABC-type transport system involved in multi-copper enzyme maturation permease subunit
MIWLSWRQNRLELLVTLAVSVALGAAMTVVTFQAQAVAAAVSQTCSSTPGPLCQAASVDFNERFRYLNTFFEAALFVLPALAGIFIGAPLLAREFEQGTARLVWTQGITRLRWLGIKLSLILTIGFVISAVLALVAGRWVSSQTGVFTNRWDYFDTQGPVFVGYVIFAIALGIAAGTLIRRVVPAMGATLVAFVAIRLAVFLWVRPNFLPPLELDISNPLTNGGDTWQLGQRAVDLAGHPVSQQYYQQLLANAGFLQGSTADYLRAHGVIVLQSYQPESRFGLFQGLEASLFAVLAAVMLGVAIWSTRRA